MMVMVAIIEPRQLVICGNLKRWEGMLNYYTLFQALKQRKGRKLNITSDCHDGGRYELFNFDYEGVL